MSNYAAAFCIRQIFNKIQIVQPAKWESLLLDILLHICDMLNAFETVLAL